MLTFKCCTCTTNYKKEVSTVTMATSKQIIKQQT